MFAAVSSLAAAHAPSLAFLEGIGAMEMVLVAFIGLLLFGGKGLPDMARTLGRAVREFKKATSAVEEEVKRAMNEEPAPKPRPPRPRPAPLQAPAPTPPAGPPAPEPPSAPAAEPPKA